MLLSCNILPVTEVCDLYTLILEVSSFCPVPSVSVTVALLTVDPD